MSDAAEQHPMLGATTNAETLAELRNTFNLHENIPKVTDVHVLRILMNARTEEGMMVLCVHDEANEAKYDISYPIDTAKQLEAADGGDAPINAGVKFHVSRIVSAAWN